MSNLSTRMIALAAQENNDGEEYDLLHKGGTRLKELEAGIKIIAPWLSASLTDRGSKDYLSACNEIFRLDQ